MFFHVFATSLWMFINSSSSGSSSSSSCIEGAVIFEVFLSKAAQRASYTTPSGVRKAHCCGEELNDCTRCLQVGAIVLSERD